jgi:thioredoxin-related protein
MAKIERRAGHRRKLMDVSWLRDKRVLIIIFVFLGFASLAIYDYSRPTVGKVSWVDEYEKALEESRLIDEPLMMYFYAGWCSGCKKLERDTFSNDEVASLLNDNFICLKINVEEHPSLMAQYVIPGFPTVVFLSPKGVEMGRIMGYTPPDIFMIMVSQYVPVIKS